jgi:hypothetical protein
VAQLAPTLALAVGFALLSVSLPAGADHPQDANGGTIVFDHRTGNEWWVEVRIAKAGDPIDQVLARSESGTWHALTLRSWGNWAASFHIPPGERVQFQAAQFGGMSDVWRVTSCFFTHPAGLEQCDGGATQPFSAAFRSPSGTEWWQQVYINSNRPLSAAYAAVHTVNGPDYRAMTLRSWGAWATSSHAPSGSIVSFLAVSGDEQARSSCYRWPDATPVSCPTTGPPVTDASMTRFDHKSGNEWWVEVLVGPIEPTQVLARDDGGPWVPLALQSWGAWAGSFHIEPGHKVQFRAQVDGAWLESCWFTHPGGLSPTGTQVCEGRFV